LKILFSGRAMQQLLVSPQEMLVTFDDFWTVLIVSMTKDSGHWQIKL
jgi:hypothetical protein